MRQRGRRRLPAVARAGALSLVAALGAGCGTTDCSETATCPDPSEAAAEANADSATDSEADGNVGDDESATNGLVDAGDNDGDDGRTSDGTIPVRGDADADSSAPVDANASADASGPPDAHDGFDAAGDAPRTCIPTGPEICNNGRDDDCNGLTDCADRAACPTFACAGPEATGWVGPALLWTGPYPASQVPSCPAGYQAVDAFQGVTFPKDLCSCTCTPSGQQCSPTATAYVDQACSLSCASVAASGTGACTPLRSNGCGSNGSFAVTGPPSPGGTCTSQVTAVDGGAPSWTNTVRLCTWVGLADSPGGCTATGAQCVPAPAPFGSVCVFRAGDVASCPAGYDAGTPMVVYAGATDQRGCSGCSCGAPTGASCSGSVRFYAGGSCAGTGVQNTQACTPYALSPSPGSAKATYTLTPGSCSVVSPPAPVGSVVATGPTTVCCH